MSMCCQIATGAMRVFELIVALLQAAVIRPPPPHEVLHRAPPRCITSHSRMEDAFAAAPLRDAVIAAMRRQLASGRQVGIAVAVYHHGQEICHVCGGMFRAAGSGWGRDWSPVDGDTLFMGYSVVKGVAATCLMSCVDRGEVSYQQPVSAVWPAFAARGKSAVTVADAVSHRAGAYITSVRALCACVRACATHARGRAVRM